MERTSLDRETSPSVHEEIDEEQQKRGLELEDRLERLLCRAGSARTSPSHQSRTVSQEATINTVNYSNHPESKPGNQPCLQEAAKPAQGHEDANTSKDSHISPQRSDVASGNQEELHNTPHHADSNTLSADVAASPESENSGLHGTAKSLKNQREIDFTANFVEKRRKKPNAKAANAEEEAAALKKAEEEAAALKKAEEEAAALKKAEEEAAALKKAEEEAARKKAEEEAARKKAEEEAAALKKAEEEAAALKKAEEEAALKKAEEEAAALKKAEEEAARKKAEEEAARKKAEEEAARKKAEEEAAALKKAEEEAARNKAEEEAALKKAEKEAAARKKAEEAAARKKAEEAALKKAEEAAARKKADMEAAAVRRAEKEAAAQRRVEEEAALKKAQAESAAQHVGKGADNSEEDDGSSTGTDGSSGKKRRSRRRRSIDFTAKFVEKEGGGHAAQLIPSPKKDAADKPPTRDTSLTTGFVAVLAVFVLLGVFMR